MGPQIYTLTTGQSSVESCEIRFGARCDAVGPIGCSSPLAEGPSHLPYSSTVAHGWNVHCGRRTWGEWYGWCVRVVAGQYVDGPPGNA